MIIKELFAYKKGDTIISPQNIFLHNFIV